jgi:hypothetical protein
MGIVEELDNYFYPQASILKKFGVPGDLLKSTLVDRRSFYWYYYSPEFSYESINKFMKFSQEDGAFVVASPMWGYILYTKDLKSTGKPINTFKLSTYPEKNRFRFYYNEGNVAFYVYRLGKGNCFTVLDLEKELVAIDRQKGIFRKKTGEDLLIPVTCI